MITLFPDFTSIEFEHRDFINQITSKFLPYSDFNFTSLFSWNFDGSTAISNLNGNLVIKLPDYITGDPVLTIIGDQELEGTITALLSLDIPIKLVPEQVSYAVAKEENFTIAPDPDNFDYIFDLNEHALLPSPNFRGKRKKLRRFEQRYSKDVSVDLISTSNESLIDDIFTEWAEERQSPDDEVTNERKAILRLLPKRNDLNLKIYIFTLGNRPVGFSINEIISDGYSICHFQKCLVSYPDLDIFITNFVAKELVQAGCTYINWEQDLGIDGLRQLKNSYHPIGILKKFSIS